MQSEQESEQEFTHEELVPIVLIALGRLTPTSALRDAHRCVDPIHECFNEA